MRLLVPSSVMATALVLALRDGGRSGLRWARQRRGGKCDSRCNEAGPLDPVFLWVHVMTPGCNE
ncbi:hypothetical protein GCM10009596_16280 [Arthrobacter rhombi]